MTAEVTGIKGKTSSGRAWKFSSDISSDQLISARHVFEFDPRMLRHHLLAEVRPEFAQQAQPGDVIVAGRNFAHGSNHSHPFLAMKALGVGLLVRSLSRGPFRLAIFMGVPVLMVTTEVLDAIDDGHQLDIDFSRGEIHNVTTGKQMQVEPLSPFLQDIVNAGGGLEFVKTTLVN
jgi:3-isopropylmalate/(R)-2-methylmalate dehydratase small subunit